MEDAQALLHPGQWFLDSPGDTLYYEPLAGQQMTSLDVELPHLESLLQGAGTLASPLHDVTFSGLQFSYATWNAPSSAAGFSDVQSNLHMTGATNQGMCTFSTPAGSCPWGALTQPLANVSFTASNDITLTGDRFAGLGGAGLSVMYGSANTRIQGDEFTDIASTAMLLGCTYDPLPTDPSEAAGIKQNCTPNSSAVSGDTIGTNEILTGTTVSDNIIHNIGTDYTSASGITLLFSRGTTIADNDLYNLPYTGITAGVIQGHVDQASTPQNSTNINEDNSITDNVFHNFLQVRSDGGAIYAEGHQAQYVYEANGTTINQTATLAQGLQVTGNVAYNAPRADFTYYDDAGSEWINWQGNVAFDAGSASQGGCSPTGNFWITGNYFSNAVQSYPCAAPVNSNASGNTTISATPAPGAIPNSLLGAAGVASAFSALAVAAGPQIYYTSPTTSTTTQVLVAGEGFSSSLPVYVNGTQVSGVQYLSGGFLIVPVPAGTSASQISVGTPPAGLRLNDTDPTIGYSGFSYSANRGLGDYDNDVHYATANGSTATVTFTGTGIQVMGEQYTDQGNIGISIDGGTQQTISTLPTDGQRHSNVAVYTATGLTPGNHTIVVTKLSGTYTTLDGFNITTVPAARLNDTEPTIGYSGFSYSANRGLGDYDNDVHYATANGSTATLTFTGTAIQVMGEQYTDQGNIGISIDGGTQQTISTLPTDGQRHSNVAVYTATGLTPGNHTIVVTKLSGTYTTLDGFNVTDVPMQVCTTDGRPDVGDHVGQSLEPVADDEEHVPDAAVAQVGQDAHPELGALPAGPGPQPQDVLLAREGDPDRGVARAGWRPAGRGP